MWVCGAGSEEGGEGLDADWGEDGGEGGGVYITGWE